MKEEKNKIVHKIFSKKEKKKYHTIFNILFIDRVLCCIKSLCYIKSLKIFTQKKWNAKGNIIEFRFFQTNISIIAFRGM